jgi:hypothetical protein
VVGDCYKGFQRRAAEVVACGQGEKQPHSCPGDAPGTQKARQTRKDGLAGWVCFNHCRVWFGADASGLAAPG